MKQYIKSIPIKWGFKHWYRCDSNTGYVYHFQLYQGRKTTTEFNLGESVVLSLCKDLRIATSTSSPKTVSTTQQLFKS